MTSQLQTDNPAHMGNGKLNSKVAIVTGWDCGIGRAGAAAFAKEGADAKMSYLKEEQDAGEVING